MTSDPVERAEHKANCSDKWSTADEIRFIKDCYKRKGVGFLFKYLDAQKERKIWTGLDRKLINHYVSTLMFKDQANDLE